MADSKISALPAATTPLAGTEVLPIVQSSSTKQVSVANLTAGRIQTSNGVVQGTAATGYNFTANTPAAGMTSQLLNWYEEGTWTPGVSFGGGTTGITYSTQAGTYTRIGNRVLFQGRVVLTSKGSSTGSAVITGLPFSTNATAYGAFSVQMNNVLSTTTTPIGQIVPGVTTLTLAQLTAGINTLLTNTDFANNTVVNVTGLYLI